MTWRKREIEALKLALKALETCNWVDDGGYGHAEYNHESTNKAITAIKEALAQPETDWERVARIKEEMLRVSFEDNKRLKEALEHPEHGWTPERIAGMARLKEAQDKKLAQLEQPKVRTGNCLRVGVCASEGHKIAPQRKPLTDEEIYDMYNEPRSDAEMIAFARAIEAAHGIQEDK